MEEGRAGWLQRSSRLGGLERSAHRPPLAAAAPSPPPTSHRRWASEHSKVPALVLPPATMDPETSCAMAAPALVVAASDSLDSLKTAFEWALHKMARPGARVLAVGCCAAVRAVLRRGLPACKANHQRALLFTGCHR